MVCDEIFFFLVNFFSGYYNGYFILGVTFYSGERAVERAVCAYDSDARSSNSDNTRFR